MTTQTVEILHDFQIAGRPGLVELWEARDVEILAEGPRGSGKTRTIFELLDQYCRTYEKLAVLVVRATQKSLADTCVKTFRDQVLVHGDGTTYFGGNTIEAESFRYQNGSHITLGGMDNAEKFKSAEYSLIYVNEATEITEDDWLALKALLRQAHPSKPKELYLEFPRLIGDCNPTYSGHWLNLRCERGETRRVKTRLTDNPFLYEADGTLTQAGEHYVGQILESYQGAARERWLYGNWTGVENAAYPLFDRAVHVRPLPVNTTFQGTVIGTDYGATHECAVVAVSIDQWNRRWVREAWAQKDDDEGASLNLTIARFKQRYATNRGMGDPNQKYLNDRHGFRTASGSAGTRQKRIDLLEPLFRSYPGGRVPSVLDEGRMVPALNYAEPDSPGIFLVEGAPGIEKLAGQIESYHYVFTESDVKEGRQIVRANDDMVAAVEYANEEWVEGGKPELPTSVANPLRNRGRNGRRQQRKVWNAV